MVETVEAHDGRRLEVFVEGPDDGTLVIHHHGTPSSGMLYGPRVAAAASRGLRVAGFSRPGYGGSDRNEGRSVADVAADVDAIADALGADRFYTSGGSGGGPHVLATAALLPDRVIAAASLAGVVPWGAEGIDYLAGMGDENVEEFGLALEDHDGLRAFMEPRRESMLKATPEGIVESMRTLLSPVDAALLGAELGEFLAAELAHALEHDIWGWFDDDLAFVRPWGFDLEAISVPVAIWHGGQDRFVSPAHGEWLAANVPGATSFLLPDEGHLSVADENYDQILDELMAAGERVP